MIVINKEIIPENFEIKDALNTGEDNIIYDRIVFFDLEHYIYKIPICIGVFGACFYDSSKKKIIFTQYMIENNDDSTKIVYIIEKYLKEMNTKNNIDYCITFSGNNDFTVLNHLFEKNGIDMDILSSFKKIDLQKEYEKQKGRVIGLKELEKEFEIVRESEVLSGSNLAKTICKINSDSKYISRMPQIKKDNILKYNEQDVISLFTIFVDWNKNM